MARPAYVTHDKKRYLWLGGCVERVVYDFDARAGIAVMLPGHCEDHTSIVRFFRQIDPDVQRIVGFSAGAKSTLHIISGDDTKTMHANIEDEAEARRWAGLVKRSIA